MSLSESLSTAADYTRRFFDRAFELLLLFILTLIPVVNILTLGYLGRVIADRADSRQPPRMEKYTDMFVNGLKYLVAMIVWAIPILIVAVIVAVGLIAPAAITASPYLSGNYSSPAYWQNFNYTSWSQFASQHTAVANLVLAIIPSVIIVAIVAIIIELFAFIGIVHMFKTGSFGKAFALGEISSIISKIGWLRYLGYILVAVFLGILVSVFNAIPLIGWLISLFLGLLLYIFLARSIGLMYDSAVGGIASVASPTPQPAMPNQPAPSGTSTSTFAMQPTETAVTAPIYCAKCGAPNPREAVYCNKCGSALTK